MVPVPVQTVSKYRSFPNSGVFPSDAPPSGRYLRYEMKISRDYELALKCENSCENSLEKCISECGPDTSCISSCTRTHAFCLDGCPCNANCPSGCDSCPDSSFCSSVLVLNTCQQNEPLLYNYGLGDLSENLDFTMKQDTGKGSTDHMHGPVTVT